MVIIPGHKFLTESGIEFFEKSERHYREEALTVFENINEACRDGIVVKHRVANFTIKPRSYFYEIYVSLEKIKALTEVQEFKYCKHPELYEYIDTLVYE